MSILNRVEWRLEKKDSKVLHQNIGDRTFGLPCPSSDDRATEQTQAQKQTYRAKKMVIWVSVVKGEGMVVGRGKALGKRV